MNVEKKTCLKCRATKPLRLFPKLGVRNGVQKYRSHCSDCRNAELRTTRDNQRRAHVTNATPKEISPHGEGLAKFKGWGWLGA